MGQIAKKIKENPLAWTVQAVGLLVVIANVWIALKLAPVAKDIDSVTTRVTAIELRNTKADPLISDYIITKTELVGVKEDVSEIKSDVKDIKNFLNVR